MKTLVLGVVCALGFGAPSALAADAQLMAPITKFIDSFNKGDVPGAAATHTAEAAIIDEVPPHVWKGAKGFETWLTDLDSDAKAKGLTDQGVTLSAPSREEVTGDNAYVVVPAVYAYKEKGVAMREPGQMTFALHKEAGGWKISAWTWTGPKPTRAK